MKLKHFFYAGVFAVGIAACSDNEEIGNAQTPTEANVYMTLQIVGPQGVGSRTMAGAQGTVLGSDEENTISSVKILLCNHENHSVVAFYDVADLTQGTNGVVTTPVIQTRTGEYDVYVIANPPATLSIATGDNITQKLVQDISMTSMQNQYAHDNTFMMFNECNGDGTSDNADGISDISGVPIEITEENVYTNPATCNLIELDRLAVKITSTEGEDIDISGINDNGGDTEFSAVTDVSLLGFKLLNGATQAYLQQKWVYNTTEQGNTAPWANTLITPILDEGSSTDATRSPGYYNHLSDFRTIEHTQQTEGSGVTYTEVKDLYSLVASYGSTDTSPIYCMENNPTWNGTGIVDALNGNTTGLVYQWQVTLENNASDNLLGSNTFYSYNGTYYGTLEAISNAYPTVFDDGDPETDVTAELAAAQQELRDANELTGSEKEDAISDFRTKYKIKVYTGGIMYYIHYIKDQNYQQGSPADRYYSVMRNTVYSLNVTGLLHIGTDIPGGWNPDKDPEDPVDPTNVYMVVEAQANPWVVSSEDITLQ